MEEKEIEVNEEKKSLIYLEYDQSTEETYEIGKFTISINYSIKNIIFFGLFFVLGLLILFIADGDYLLNVCGWIITVVSPLLVVTLIISRVNILKSIKKLDKTSHLIVNFCNDKIRFQEKCGEESTSVVLEYANIKKVYLHNDYTVIRFDKLFYMINAKDKKYDVVNLIKEKNNKIKVINK